MPRFKAQHIDDCEPGCIVEINGRRYVRMADMPSHHMEGWIFDPETGHATHWSRLVLHDEMVSIGAAWGCPDCRRTGVAHCAHPDECGGMRLHKA